MPDFFELDQNALDKEWVEQPHLYHEYAVKLADARKLWEQAKNERDLVEAELDRDVRANPKKYSIEKITEPLVDKTVVRQVEFQRELKKVIEAKHAVDVLQAVVDALEHRKKALENLVHLRLSDYFSEPRTPRGVERNQVDDFVRQDRKRGVPREALTRREE